MAANDAVSMNVAENRQNVPMAIQENRAAVPMTVAEGGGTPGGLNRKADKVTGAAAGNLAGLDSTGNLTDSGKAPEDFLEAPASAGTQGQVLTADGEGGASWQDPTGGDPTEIIDDNAGSGDTDKVWSADKSHALLTEIHSVSPEKFGAKGDGVTDDSAAVQDAVDSGYAVYFASNKTYYLASTVTIDHDCHLFGGENTIIKTKTPSGGIANEAFIASGTLKKTTALTTNYTENGDTENVGDRFSLEDMESISIGDIMEIQAEDQLFSKSRGYYYLGGCLLVCDVTDDYIWTCDALPFSILNTEYVTVDIYSAPTIMMENLRFESDHDSAGEYVYAVTFTHCKNSTIRNCTVSEADNGIKIDRCVNTSAECVTVEKMPLSGTGRAIDHYGLAIYSSTNTSVRKMMGNAANSCIDMSGTIPNLNTWIKECSLFALSRHNGLGMHENAYNTIVEDCVLGGFAAYGTVTVNRCRFIQSFRDHGQTVGINFKGTHDPKHGKLVVRDCVFESADLFIRISTPHTQDNPQAYHHIIGEILVENCIGGGIAFTASATEYILSNAVQKFTLRNWRNCKEFYHSGGLIDSLVVHDCEFNHKLWINDHANHLATDGIRFIHITNDDPKRDRIYIDIKKHGGTYYLPGGIDVVCDTQNATDHFVVCGKNLMSNNPSDLGVGSVSGTVGSALERTEVSAFASSLSVNANNEIVFTQPDENTTKQSVYPKCLVLVPKYKTIKMSCKIKNTGETSGASFRAYIITVDLNTGLITYRGAGTSAQATASGVVLTHSREITEDTLVLCYLYCYESVAGSETTLSDFVVEMIDVDFDKELTFEEFTGSSRNGSGTLQSVEGVNNFLINASGAFDVKSKADLLE